MNFKQTAEEIIENMGGADNIKSLIHCHTRLRFTVNDMEKVNSVKIEQLKEVVKFIEKAGQCQVVIGNEVGNVYREIMNMVSMEGVSNAQGVKKDEQKEEKSSFNINMVFDTLAGIFTPILPILTGAGMIQAVLILLSTFGIVTPDNPTYIVFGKIANAGFYYLPIMLGYTTAKKFNANPFLAMMLGGVLLHPSLLQAADLTIFGFAVKTVNYSSSVLPIILIVIFMSFVEKLADKYSPTMIKFFTVPLITIIITAPVGLLVLGPLGFTIGGYLASGISFLSNNCGWLAVPVMAAVYPLMVMTGMHHAYAPIALASVATFGYEAVMAPAGLCSNIAQGGAALAVAVKSKDKDVKALASSGGVTCVLGISEPVMYGISLKYKTPLYATMAGAAIGGLMAGIWGVRAVTMASPGLASIAIFFGTTFLYAMVSIALAFISGFVISFVLFKDK